MVSRLVVYLRSRRALLLGPLVFAWVGRWGADGRGEVPQRSAQALVSALERASGATVAVEDLRWQPSAGIWGDAVFGRSLVFLGRPNGDAGNDVWQTWVRLTPAGQPIAVAPPSNWTRTPLADERGLDVAGSHIAYAAVYQGQLQGVSLVAFHSRSPWWLLASRWQTRWAQHVHLPPVERLSLQLEDAALRLELPSAPGPLRIALNAMNAPAQWLSWRVEGEREVRGEAWTTPAAFDFASQRAIPAARGWPHWFGLRVGGRGASPRERDSERRALALGPAQPQEESTHASSGQPQPARAADTRASSAALGPPWPPPSIEPLLADELAGEGAWADVVEAADQAGMLRTFIRSDSLQPEVRVHLVAMDLTRFELAMEAGWSVPRSRTGLPGRGRPPANVQARVVAAFNGAGNHAGGMQVDQRLLVPLEPGPTIAVHEDSRVGIGSWSASEQRPPADWKSLRQVDTLLLEAGVVNPSLAEQGMAAERSALCLARGALVYAWGKRLTRAALLRALRAASCRDAVELAHSPGHGAFVAIRRAAGRIEARTLLGGSEVDPGSYLDGSERDFFYLLRREHEVAQQVANWGGLEWFASPGPQPQPQAVPAIYGAEQQRGELRIALLALDKRRVRYAVTAGTGEPVIAGRAAPRRELEDTQDVLLTLELGHTTRALRYGLWVDQRRTLPLRSQLANLWIDEQERLRVAAPAQSPPAGAQSIVQLPLLMDDGELTQRARAAGAQRRRGALCVHSEGRVMIASATHDSSGLLALALRQLGCRRVVELERGGKHALRLHRRAPAQGPREATRLYAMGREAALTTFSLSEWALR